jgi:hypothetical protein
MGEHISVTQWQFFGLKIGVATFGYVMHKGKTAPLHLLDRGFFVLFLFGSTRL